MEEKLEATHESNLETQLEKQNEAQLEANLEETEEETLEAILNIIPKTIPGAMRVIILDDLPNVIHAIIPSNEGCHCKLHFPIPKGML